MILIGCNEEDINTKTVSGPELTDITSKAFPIDSLNIKVPGKNGLKNPQVITSKIPDYQIITPDPKVYPGISYLRQNLDQRLSNEPKVKSKPPIIKPFNGKEVTYYNTSDYKTEVINISEPLLVNINEINDFKEIAIKKGRFNILNGDTILPPIKFIPGKPKLIKAGKPGYKYDALTNISNINRDQNLPNSFIKRILIDSNNIVWFATAGVVLFLMTVNTFSSLLRMKDYRMMISIVL